MGWYNQQKRRKREKGAGRGGSLAGVTVDKASGPSPHCMVYVQYIEVRKVRRYCLGGFKFTHVGVPSPHFIRPVSNYHPPLSFRFPASAAVIVS